MIRTLVAMGVALLLAGCGSIVQPVEGSARDGGGGRGGIPGGGVPGGGGGGGGAGPGGPSGCADDPVFFTDRVWNPILEPRCLTCHIAGGTAKDTRLVLVPESNPDWLAINQAAFRAAAALEHEGEPLLLLKPTGLHPAGHTGGKVIEPGSQAARDLEHLVAWVRGEIPCGDETGGGGSGGGGLPPIACEDEAGPRLLRRLSHAEYRRTIADLLGLEAERAGSFAPDPAVRGFANEAGALQVDPLLADQYRASAEELAAAAVATRLDQIIPCHREASAECAASLIHDFGLRAFRRPLTTEEQRRYADLFVEVAEEDGFAEGVRWVITAILQSPHFLYRSELGSRSGDGLYTLGPWELATQLAYLFTGSTPDAELLAAAASGALATEAGLRAQVERLAAHPRSKETMSAFFTSWLELERLQTVPRDAAIHPALTPAIRTAMEGEIARVVADLVESDATLADALTLERSWMTDELAAYYGIAPGTGPADEAGFRRVSTAGTPRRGLLALGGVLMTHALPTGSSPIHRGLLVRERFLCTDLPPPPANLDTSPPPVDPALSTRERYARHASDEACASCHDLIDPIGFAFEHFDGGGRWRERDGAHEIDDSGAIVRSVSTDGTFHGVQGLAEKLAASREVERCFTGMWTAWALGMAQSDALACALQEKLPAGGGIASLRRAVTELAHFRTRRGGAEEGNAPAPAVDPGPVAIAWTPPTVSLVIDETGRWGSRYCVDATVTNRSNETLAWQVETEVEGTITDLWSAVSAPGADGKTIFSGVSWNRELAPGASTTFGWCAQ